MAVFRVNKTKNFTVMSNHHLNNKELSFKAKGLLSYMLSLPEDWDYSVQGLMTSSSDRETSVRSALKELEDIGYLIRERKFDEGKISGMEYNIFENPVTQSSQPDDQRVGNQVVQKQVVQNRPQLSTNQLNTKKTQNTQNKEKIQNTGEQSSPSLDSKLFSTNIEKNELTIKQTKWVNFNLDKLDYFDFSEQVEEELYLYFISLAEVNTLHGQSSMHLQLAALKEKVNTDEQRIQVIRETITRGWKSLAYQIDNIIKQGRNEFDTAANSVNQLYTEEQKRQMREEYDNTDPDDLF